MRVDLLKVVNSQLFIWGKMLATNRAKYPFVMKNQKGTLFVDRNGKILTANNEVAGYLTRSRLPEPISFCLITRSRS